MCRSPVGRIQTRQHARETVFDADAILVGAVLVTGFEPFGNHGVNVSGSVARLLDGLIAESGNEIVSRVLPVTYRDSVDGLWDWVSLYAPESIVMLGLTPLPSYVRVESCARNWVGDGADIDGVRLGPNRIFSSGPEHVTATVDTGVMVNALKAAGISAIVSEDAGDYVCNYLFYCIGEGLQDSGIPVGFLHTPASVVAGELAHALRGIL